MKQVSGGARWQAQGDGLRNEAGTGPAPFCGRLDAARVVHPQRRTRLKHVREALLLTVAVPGLAGVIDLAFAIGPAQAQSVFATGDVTPSGATSPTWTVSGDLHVGNTGTGALTLTNGGQVASNAMAIIGVGGDADGTVTVSGNGSTWNLGTSGSLTVGDSGTGILTIENGGQVTGGTQTYVGYMPGSVGQVTVTGSGSTWDLGSSLFVLGNGGTAMLSVEDGGLVTSATSYIGASGGGSSLVTVTGSGSTWTLGSEALYVAYGGGGALTIDNGGQVTNGSTNIAGMQGVSGTVTVAGSAAEGQGRLTTGQVIAGPGTAQLVFDGGIVQASGDQADFLSGFQAGDILVQSGGAFIDTNGFDIGISAMVKDDPGLPLGSGGLTKLGAGTLTLTGMNTYSGLTTVAAGTLVVGVEGRGFVAGAVSVSSGAQLGGSGSIGGIVTIASGGTLAPGNGVGTLSVNGLVLNEASILDFELATPGVTGAGVNDLVEVSNALTLDGQLHIDALSGFGVGSYTLFQYASLTADNELLVASGPAGYNYTVDLSTSGEVNLVVSQDGLQFWNGETTTADGVVHGGTSTWDASSTNWTDPFGATSATWGALTAVFSGAASTVTVAEDVSVAGLQFGTDGYVLNGPGAIQLTGSSSAILVDAGLTATVNAELTGDARLDKTGSGTLVLGGTNTYSGGTRLLAGTLEVSADANLGVASGGLTFYGGTLATTTSFATARDVSLAGTGTFDVADGTALALTGTITGAGGLVKQGAGTLVLSGANDYAGGTTFGAGRAEVSADTNLGAASGGLTFAGGTLATTASFTSARNVEVETLGSLDVAGNSALELSGSISGEGTLAKQGTGALALSGRSTVDWDIQEGSLAAQATAFAGDVAIGSDAILLLNAGTAASYAGTLTGEGTFAKTGTGSLNYTGDGAGFSGLTQVEAGRLAVNGTLGGAVSVLSGATLGGNGTVGSVTLADGAVIAPGNSTGTLNVAGDIVFAAGSTYEVELAGDGASDLIQVSGQAALNGASLTLAALDPTVSYQNGRSAIILTAVGGVEGSFGAIETGSVFLAAGPSEEDGAVTLTIELANGSGGAAPSVFTTVTWTANQSATASALDTLAQSGAPLALYNALLFLPSAQEARAAFGQLSGEVHASAQSMFMEQSSLIRAALIDRLRAVQGAVGASAAGSVSVIETSSGGLAYAAPSSVQTAADLSMPVQGSHARVERFALWTTGFGNWGRFDGTGNAAKLSDSTGGFLIGADAIIGDGWRLGLAGGYSTTNFSVADRSSSGSSDNWHVGLYGGKTWGALALRTGLAYTWQDISTARSVAFSGFADSLSANYDAGTFQTFGELGWRIDTAYASFEPYANLAYVNLDAGSYLEEGGAAALSSDGGGMDTTFSTLGLRASRQVTVGSLDTILRGAIGWRHAFGDITPTVTQAFLSSDAFTVGGVPIAENAAILEAGLDLKVGTGTTLGAAYTGQFGDGVMENGFNANLKVQF